MCVKRNDARIVGNVCVVVVVNVLVLGVRHTGNHYNLIVALVVGVCLDGLVMDLLIAPGAIVEVILQVEVL